MLQYCIGILLSVRTSHNLTIRITEMTNNAFYIATIATGNEQLDSAKAGKRPNEGSTCGPPPS